VTDFGDDYKVLYHNTTGRRHFTDVSYKAGVAQTRFPLSVGETASSTTTTTVGWTFSW